MTSAGFLAFAPGPAPAPAAADAAAATCSAVFDAFRNGLMIFSSLVSAVFIVSGALATHSRTDPDSPNAPEPRTPSIARMMIAAPRGEGIRRRVNHRTTGL